MQYGVGEVARVCADRISQLDTVTNNLANIGTSGFKFANLYFEVKNRDKAMGDASPSAPYLALDFSQGIMQKTDNALDVAIRGEGFFTIETGEGRAYTRKGNFTINKKNQLVTQSGKVVLGETGPIAVSGQNVHIDGQGGVRVDGVEVGKLMIVGFGNRNALVRYGDGLFKDPGTGGIRKLEKPEVSSMHLEMANVNAVREMVAMIDIQRSFESYQKVIQTIQDLDKLSTSRLGKLY